MDHLRHGIHLRGYAQKNPKQEYKRESFTLFQELLDSIKRDTIRVLSHVQVRREDPAEEEARLRREAEELAKRMQFQHAEAPSMEQAVAGEEEELPEGPAPVVPLEPVRNEQKIGPQRALPVRFRQEIQALSRAAGLSFPPGSPTPRPVLPLAAFVRIGASPAPMRFPSRRRRRHRVHCLVKERVPMAVGLGPLSTLHPVPGFELGIASAGIKRPGRKDVVVMRCAEGSSVAGVFTLNAFCAAPVTLAKQRFLGEVRYLLTNTGNANAGTGEAGLAAAAQTCAKLAELAGVAETSVLPYSTGVIGEPLPVAKIEAALPAALADLAEDRWAEAAAGIMTTDTLPKGASRQFVHDGVTVTVTGISKGAGMIKPNMATMLGYIATDAKVAQGVLQDLLRDAANKSFNRITIDGDTSTNDCCMLIATGRAALPEVTQASGALFAALKQAVLEVSMELAQAIVRDGEGATKFVTVQVNGGATHQECLDVGYAVAHSPLIKTALFASDPNWGRILAAVGRAGVANLDVSKIDVFLGDVCIASRGGRAASYTEEQGAAVMAQAEIGIRIELGRGTCSETIWTTDLSHEYVKINAEYRT